MEHGQDNYPIHILQVVTYMGRGGIETMLMNYYRHIDHAKIQFDFLVHREFRADFDDEIEAIGGHIYRIPPMNPISRAYRKALRDFFHAHKYQIVHCHLNYMSGVILAEAKRAGVPVRIAHAHTANMDPGWKQWVRRAAKYRIPSTATVMLACSREAGNAVFGKHPFSVMANAIDAEKFCYSEVRRAAMRQKLGLMDCFTVIHVGRFVYPKNHSFLIDVFAEVLKFEPTAKLVLVGDGELRTAIEEKAKKCLPDGTVLFLGMRSDIADLLQAADVFAFPSYFEGLPVTMVEAQAAGLPCVKSDTITDECIVTDLVTSLPITNPALWAEEIMKKRCLPRKNQMKEITASGYDIVAAAKKLERFYLNGEPL